MDKELLAAIGEILDKKLDEKLDQRLVPIRQDIAGLDQKFTGLDLKVTGLQQDMTGVKQDIAGLQKQNEKISIAIINNSYGIHKLVEGQDKLSEGLFQLQSDFKTLHEGQMRIETKLEQVDAKADAAGRTYRDHEKRIQSLEDKATAQ